MKKLLIAIAISLMIALPALAAVDLNTASQAELETVSGIGPTKAKAIIDYRKKNGNFKSVDELDNVPGFGKASIDKMRKEITVGNAKAATAGKPEKNVKPLTPTVAKPVAPSTPAPAATDKNAKKQ